jgi:hypothetical protein
MKHKDILANAIHIEKNVWIAFWQLIIVTFKPQFFATWLNG